MPSRFPTVVRKLTVPAVILASVLAVGFVLFDDLRRGSRAVEPPAVIFSAPPGFRMEEGGELSRPEAARWLAAILDARPEGPRFGIHFTSGGFELFWLVDRSQPAEPVLIELAGGPTGTRVETRYPGAIAERLAWASQRGQLDPPGAPPGEARNLYH